MLEVPRESSQAKLKNLGLPTKSLRSILITGKETDRRQEFEQIVEDFPKINDQKSIISGKNKIKKSIYLSSKINYAIERLNQKGFSNPV